MLIINEGIYVESDIVSKSYGGTEKRHLGICASLVKIKTALGNNIGTFVSLV